MTKRHTERRRDREESGTERLRENLTRFQTRETEKERNRGNKREIEIGRDLDRET